MAIESKPSPGSVPPRSMPSKRPLAPRVQLPASLPLPAQEPCGGAPTPGPKPPPAPAAPPQPAPAPVAALPPAPAAPAPAPVLAEAERPRARSKSPTPTPKLAAVATQDQNAILAMFNLESEDPQERENDNRSPRRSYDENAAPNVRGQYQKGRGREPARDLGESLADFDRQAQRRQPPGGRQRRSSSREAMRLVADYASPEEGGSWEDATGKKPAVELTEHREKPVDFMSRASTFTDVVIEWVEAPNQTQLLYPYGVDGPIVNYLEGQQPYAERHGDGLMSAREVKLWLDRLDEIEQEEKQAQEKKFHGETRFNRQMFTWRQREHKLLRSSYPTPEGSCFGEVPLTWTIVEHYEKSRETQHNLIVISEVQQCWLIAQLAERHVPNPSAVFSKKKKGRGWHCAISNFEPLRKWYIMPEPPEEGEEVEQTISMASSVQKVHDGNTIQFDEAMAAMKHICAYQTGPGGGWIYCGIGGEDMDESFAADKEEGCKFQFLSARPPLVGER